MRELIGIFDVMVSTSLWEGLPCTFLEAMALSKPIVATSVDGVTDIIEDGVNGFLAEIDKKGASHYPRMAEKISYLLNNRGKALEMGARGREKLKNEFDINRVAREIEGIYEKTA